MTPLMDNAIGRTARIAREHAIELVIADASPDDIGMVICTEDEAERNGYMPLYIVSPCGCYTDDISGAVSECAVHRAMGARI